MNQLDHIIETLKVMKRENPDSDKVLETLNLVVNILESVSPNNFTTCSMTRVLKLGGLTVTVDYTGDRHHGTL